MSANWLYGLHHHTDEPDQPQAMPVFEGPKLVVVGGSSGMGRATAADVVAAGGSAVIIGQDQDRVDDTVRELAKDGKAYGITAELTDRDQVERVRQQLAGEHADATLLVNAAGFFIPKPFLDYDGPFYDSYLELDRPSSSSPRPWSAAWLTPAAVGRSSTLAACGPTRRSPPPPPRRTRWLRPGCTR